MANDDSTRGQRTEGSAPEQGTNQGASPQPDQRSDATGTGDDSGSQNEGRRGLPDRGFDAGTGYGGAGSTSAYSGESSYGGQAGYGGSTTRGAYSDGKFGRDQQHLHVDRDIEDIDPSVGERGRGAKGGLEE